MAKRPTKQKLLAAIRAYDLSAPAKNLFPACYGTWGGAALGGDPDDVDVDDFLASMKRAMSDPRRLELKL